MLVIKTMVLGMVVKSSTTELYPNPRFSFKTNRIEGIIVLFSFGGRDNEIGR